MIPYGRQQITQADIDAVTRVLRSDFITQGPVVPRFEQAFAERCEAQHAVAANSATSALHLACLALGVGPGDSVWVPAITFVATANCVRYCGARVQFLDVAPDSGLLDIDQLRARLQQAEADGELPKVIIPVHLAGLSCDMAALGALAQRYKFRIIEDASHAVGAEYDGRAVGSCQFSDIAVFSFHPVKIITTAEGGMATCNDQRLAEHMRRLASHGVTRDPALMHAAPDGPWYYEQLELGFNYRMTELQAALGCSQLQRLDYFIQARREHAAAYDRELNHLPVDLPVRSDQAQSAWHLYVIRLRDAARHLEVFEVLREQGIGVNLHYIPVPAQPYYRELGHDPDAYPGARDYYARAISLPIYPDLAQAQRRQVVAVLGTALA